ncbi:hypothetical protein [Pseudomonas profundi]|uniref:hypothetical protein n=1 Tax=Pseudomonas profundi TaxID=1981513 RepID=UPI00123B81F3|nr:hypothetical protein [Pseudomonas profundi]
MEKISSETMRASQQGSYNHRHEGLSVRLKEAKRSGISVSQKRYRNRSVSLDVLVVQKLRRRVRKISLAAWNETNTASAFDAKMKPELGMLKVATKIAQYRRGAAKRIRRVLE